MRSLPLPLRVAAGLAAAAVEQARDLPTKLAGLPVTVASQALQMSMRVQQHVTELAIKGDQVLSGLRPVEETPEWATFDEDLDEQRDGANHPAPFDQVPADWSDFSTNGHDSQANLDSPVNPSTLDTPAGHDAQDDPWSLEERALAEENAQGQDGPAGMTNYDELSLPQLRARLRRFSAEELRELLEHERANANRPAFVGMLTRRIATVRDQR